jgi:hypothetical protein
VQAAYLGLLHSFGQDLLSQAIALDVHLQSRDALASACNLEVHVATVIFGAEDIGKDCIVLAFHHKPHSDTCNWLTQWHTSIHQSQGSTTNGSHRRGAVGLQNLRSHTHGVREVSLRWQHLKDGPFGQITMTNLTATHTHHATHFTDTEWRERVMQHEALWILRVDAVTVLNVIWSSQRCNTHRLGFTASKQHRPMHLR